MNDAYLEHLERQSRRGHGLLPDRVYDVERAQRDYNRRQSLANEFGGWLANDLGPWDWFVNPISFRDRHPDLEHHPKTGVPRRYRSTGRIGTIASYVADPRLKAWMPDFRGRRNPGSPVPDQALAELKDWLLELQAAAGRPIRWMIAEEFGRIGGRYHAHMLISGVAHLRRDKWWASAFKQFGRTTISPFDPARGGAFYAAKYASKQLGALHFGGPPPSGEFAATLVPGRRVGRIDVASTAALTREEVRRTDFFPKGWSNWRQKR